MTSASHSKIIVIGGGIIARCTALALLDRGCTVTLIAEPDPVPASWGNAGHIATEQVSPLATWSTLRRLTTDLFPRGPVAIDWKRPQTVLPWSLRFLRSCKARQQERGEAALRDLLSDALPAWKRLVARMDAPDLLDERGIVKLIEKSDANERAAYTLRQDWGTSTAKSVDPETLKQIASNFSAPVRAGIRFENTAHITNPTRVLDMLLKAFLSSGGTHIPAYARNLRNDSNGVIVETRNTTIQADCAVVACGVLSPALLPHLVLPMIAERGYHLEWDHGGKWTGPNVVFEDRALVVTRFENRLRATSFVEFTDHQSAPDPRKWQHLERHIRELGLPVHGRFTPWYGSRPTLPDYLPALGTTGMPGIFAACGHNHLGLTLAATTAERLTAHMLDGKTFPPALRPDRFGTAPSSTSHFRKH